MRSFAFDGIGASTLATFIELHPRVLVEQIKRPLRRRVPVAVD
jgi:hypothetical protein